MAAEICDGLADRGIARTFAIQELTLPIALNGQDLIGQARTGMGKTFGFGVPLLDRVFDDADWPMRTLATNRGAARVRAGAVVEESVISPGCDIAGTVRGSTLGPGVVVREGAVVEDSVIFDACVIERDAVVSTSILDANVAVRAGVCVGTSSAGKRAHDDAIAVVGHDSVVRSDVVAGSQIDPGSTVA